MNSQSFPRLRSSAYPSALGFVPAPGAVAEKEGFRFRGGVFAVEGLNPGPGPLKQRGVARLRFRGPVLEVREQAELHMRIAVAQIVHFQLSEQFVHFLGRADHAGHGHERARPGGDAVPVVEAGEEAGGDAQGRQPS